MSAFYSPLEKWDVLPTEAFRQALLDPNMLEPASVSRNPLFSPNVFKIEHGGDAGMVGSRDVITLPTPSVYITIGRSYGTEIGYAGDTYKDQDLMIPFTVWSNTQTTQDDVEKRLTFARTNRINVFELHNLRLMNGKLRRTPRINSPITGLVVVDYQWCFRYSVGDENIGVQPTDSAYVGPVEPPFGYQAVQGISNISLSGHRLVTTLGDGTVGYCDPSNIINLVQVPFLTLSASPPNTPLEVVNYGIVTDPSFNFIPNQPIFMGLNGTLTQTVPTSSAGYAFSYEIGGAISPTSIYFDPQVPIVLA